MSCDDCNDKIPVGPIGPQGPQGEVGPQGPQGEQGIPGEPPVITWVPLPLINGYVAGDVNPEYAIANGFIYMRGIVKKTDSSLASFTDEDFGFTKVVLTTCGDKRSLFGTTIDIEQLQFNIGGGIAPLTLNVHTLLLDSMAPLSIQ